MATVARLISLLLSDVVISEIMWGSDASLASNNNSQWIEIQNKSGASILTGDGTYKFIFYGPNETPTAKTAAVAATATALAVPAALPAGVADRVGTITDLGGYWSLTGKGQSGRTGVEENLPELTAIVPTQALASMYRVVNATTSEELDGNTAAAWIQSTPPSVNFDATKAGIRIASPGATRLITAAELAQATADAAAKGEICMPQKQLLLRKPRIPQSRCRRWVESTSAKLCSRVVARCHSGLRSPTVHVQSRSI